jgi:hypothetical protein
MLKMGFFVSDQNRLSHFYESGTYGNVSGAGQWIGKVMEHTIDENLNVIENRYYNTGTRNVSEMLTGMQHYEGTITYLPQDLKMFMFALGSVVNSGSPSPYTHVISETNNNVGNTYTSGTINPFISFALEDAQVQCGVGQNLIRTLKGCVADSLTLTANIGEPVSCELSYMAQSLTKGSGSATSVTDSGLRPFMFNDVSMQFVSGTNIQNMTNLSFSIKNGLKREEFLNNSGLAATFIPQNRDYDLTITLEGEGAQTQTIYDTYFMGGSLFNGILTINASTGSRVGNFILSGCRILDMESPGAKEGVNEQTLTIKPTSCSITEDSLTMTYGGW